jgi:hypothetical protein
LDGPCHYEVIGERVEDPTHLLVIGEDGLFYALDLLNGLTTRTELDEEWLIDTCSLTEKLAHAA